MRPYTIFLIGLAVVFLIQHTTMTWHYSETIEKAWELYLRGIVVGIWIGVLCLKAFKWWVERVEKNE